MKNNRFFQPALVAATLSPFIAEMISGSTPLRLWLNPMVLMLSLVLYGCGIILIHDLTVKWKKGWPTIFALAGAYMLIEEGFALKTLFDPDKNTLGRLWGVNWHWLFGMYMVHLVFSIATPILLTQAIFSKQKGAPWIRPRALPVLATLYVGTALTFTFLWRFQMVSPGQYAGLAAVVVLVLVLARNLPASFSLRHGGVPASFLKFWFTGLIGAALIMALDILLPLKLNWLLSSGIVLSILGLLVLYVMQQSGNGAWQPAAQFALATGITSIWFLAYPLQVARGNSLVIFFQLALIAFFVRVWPSVKANETTASI
jgi:hypothetical protein